MIPNLKVALVHDYLKEYGGAERTLSALSEIWPTAPIYTAFVAPGSTAAQAFRHKQVIPWKHHWLINRANLHSPLRFLIPVIWESFNFSDYDVVISSASGYITKGILTKPQTLHLCYCHTPPRFLYGYPTAFNWQKFFPVRIYGQLLKHQLLQYDFWAAQRVDTFIANSQNTAQRIQKFYRRSAQVIYPPVSVSQISQATKNSKTKDYYLIVSRLVGAKGWELLFKAIEKSNIKIKIVGELAGLRRPWSDLLAKYDQSSSRGNPSPASGSQSLANGKGDFPIEWLGRVPDSKLWQLYGSARALLALARDEDFGITPVEAMAAGCPVIAYAGGGYLETVIEGQTGAFFHQYSPQELAHCLKNFSPQNFSPAACRRQARKFSQEKFKKQIKQLVNQKYLEHPKSL